MCYNKISEDNGRVGGAMTKLTAEHIVGKTEFFKKDRSGNNIESARFRELEEKWKADASKNDTEEIVTEITKEGD